MCVCVCVCVICLTNCYVHADVGAANEELLRKIEALKQFKAMREDVQVTCRFVCTYASVRAHACIHQHA